MPRALYPLALLACPISMVVMMVMMRRGGTKDTDQPADAPPSTADADADAELARLRAEVDQLQAAQRDRAEPQVQDTP